MSLSKFIHDFDATTKFVIPKEQVDEVEKLVKDYVHKLLHQVRESDDRFVASDVLPAGSFYENTRVSHVPDEFDFITTLTALSDDVEFEPGCDGYARIKVKKNMSLWQEFCHEGYLMSESHEEVVGVEEAGNRIMDRFYKLVLDAVHSGVKQCSGERGTVELERMESSARGGIELNLHYNYKPKDVNNDLYKSTLTSCDISVDLVPVIEFIDVPNLRKYVKSYPRDFDDIIQNYGCFLVPKSCTEKDASNHQCWRFSFSRPEMALMSNMDENHKACYRVLKSLYIQTKKYVHTQGHLCSYVIKTAMLRHYNECGKEKEESVSTSDCLMDVLDDLISCCEDYFIPCFFDRNLNIFKVITIPVDRQGKQTGDLKYLSEQPVGWRFVALICRRISKTPVVPVSWGPFLSKLVDLVKGIFSVIDSISIDDYVFLNSKELFVAMDKHVKAFFDASEGEKDDDFLHKLNIRRRIDQERLLGFSALVETIEEDIGKTLPVQRESLKDTLEKVRVTNWISKDETPPGWTINNLSLFPQYSEITWRTYTRTPKEDLEFKANCSLEFLNSPGMGIDENLYVVATKKICEGQEMFMKFGSVSGAYDFARRPIRIGDLELEKLLDDEKRFGKRKRDTADEASV